MLKTKERAALVCAAVCLLLGARAGADDGKGWGYFGGTAGGTRYSAARQINKANVADLEVAWRYSTGEMRRRGPDLIANSSTQTTPILIDGSLVFCTPFNRIVALDPASGRERWVYDARPRLDYKIPYQYLCRGVAQWRDPQAVAGSACATRIFMGTNDSRIVAVDSRTGRPCAGFGNSGQVQVVRDWPDKYPGESKIHSAPIVAAGVVAVGSFVMDNIRTDAPPGTVFAFDARTGTPRWKFEPVPRDPSDPAFATWLEGSALKTGAANVWSAMVADEARGIIYAPVGSASPDFFGGMRKGNNLYSSSLVALDAQTGKPIWHFQSVHHDIWDYDVSAPPLLAEIRRGQVTVPAVVQNTKQGFVWVFDRTNGKPLFPIEERPVPQGGLPGEWLSPTQPFPVKPEPLIPLSVTPDDAWGFTFWDRWACRRKIEALRSEGIFTPPAADRGTILSPGAAGGANWGGAAYDPAKQLMFVNVNRVVSVVYMIPRRQIPGVEGISLTNGKDVAASIGTPYGTRREWLLSPLGAPCTAPPWGELIAVNLADGSVKWRVPLGSIEKKLPIHFEWNLGMPSVGGPVVTAGGVIFIAGTMDGFIRAFDADNGKMLWRHELQAGTQATPMTYEVAGRQYVVLVTGHHMWFNSPAGDEVVAFALPRRSK